MRTARVGGLVLTCWFLGCSSGPASSTTGGTNSAGAGGSGGGSTVTTTNASGTTGLAGTAGAPVDLSEQVSECSGSLDEREVAANLELVGSLDLSVHELVACGGLTVRVVGVLVQGVIEMIVDNDDDITPDGLVFEGEGAYRSRASDPNQETDMLLKFYDTSSGEAVPIPDDLFLASTYLVNARAETVLEVDENNPLDSTAYLEIGFDAVGPQVELLGFGANPQSPIRIESSDLDEVALDLDDIELVTEVTVVDDRDDASVDYEVETGPDPVLDIFGGTRLDYRIIDVTGAHATLDQDLTLIDDGWKIEFAGGNDLAGTIDFSVKGGAFDYDGQFSYDSSSYAEIRLTCAE
ncbi:MAG TPA: hypothetical protein VI197_12165 [Polyangiaceae bacterium]